METVEERQTPEDIRKRSFRFAVRTVRLCQYLSQEGGVGRILAAQLLGAGTAVGANAEVAQAGQSKADFISQNAIALKEARESAYWLRLLIATEVVPPNRMNALLSEAEELKRTLGAIILRRQTKRMRNESVHPFALCLLPFDLSTWSFPN